MNAAAARTLNQEADARNYPFAHQLVPVLIREGAVLRVSGARIYTQAEALEASVNGRAVVVSWP